MSHSGCALASCALGSSPPSTRALQAPSPSDAAKTRSGGGLHVPAEPRGLALRDGAAPRELGLGPVLQRDGYIRAVLARNPTLESARQAWQGALSQARAAGALDDPMLRLEVAPLSLGSAAAPVGYALGVSQKLPWFGKRSLEEASAAAEAGAAHSDYEAMRRELALSALVLFDQYFVIARSLDVNRAHLELLGVLRAAATAQFEAGRASAQDPLQADAELAHLEHDGAVLSSQQDVTVAQMNELLHRAPELPLPPPPEELPLPSIPDRADQKRLEAEALSGRAEIAAARQRGAAAHARAQRAVREHYPDVTLSTSYSSMWDMPEHRWMLGVEVNLPVGGARKADADEARASGAQYASEVLRLSDAARTQVFVALEQLQESRHVLGLFEERLLPIARARIDAARAGFIASRDPFMSVMEAEKSLRGIELDYQLARAECDRRRGELDRALGRIPGLDDAEPHVEAQ